MPADQGSTNQSVERAVALLRAFVDGRPEMRVGDIARLTGIGQSTVSRQLATLESLGLVERDEVSGLYRLGLDLLTFASVAVNQHPVHREGRQVAQEVFDDLQGISHELLDLERLVFDLLSGPNVKRLVRLFQEIGGKELRRVARERIVLFT